MKIELVDIDKAFKYYQINDINYKNRCYKCIEDINTIEDFNIKLEIEKVFNSIKESKLEIEKYFDLKNAEYCCDSWLLSNQINDIIDSNSNIAKFYNLFEVQDGPDVQKDILNFVFNMQECDDYNNLLEDTSLQILLKKQLLENKSIKIG